MKSVGAAVGGRLAVWLLKAIRRTNPDRIADSTGAFDIYAWQLLWIVGLALGSLNADHLAGLSNKAGQQRDEGLPSWLIRFSFAVAAAFLVLRYSPVDRWMNPVLLGWLIDKTPNLHPPLLLAAQRLQ